MPSTEIERKTLRNLLGLLLVVLLVVVGGPLFVIDKLFDEDRDYRLSDEMHTLAQELKAYKHTNGKYPESISVIRNSDNLCVTRFYTKCRKAHYKPSEDLQDFRMAAHSFGSIILFYHPEISMTTDEYLQLSEEEKELRMERYGAVCFFCMSSRPEGKELEETDASIPVYRKTAPIFSNQNEWPEL